MRSRLFWKLFVLQLSAAALLLGCALLVMNLYATYSFSAFVEMQERHRLQDMANQIAQEYERSGDLEAAARAQLLHRPDPGNHRSPPGPPPNGEDRPPARESDWPAHRPDPQGRAPGMRNQGPPHRLGPPPLQVEDAAGAFIAGDRFEPPPHGAHRVEIRARDRLVGYLTQPRPPIADHPELNAFKRQQLRVLWMIGAGALLLAALIAALIAGLILRPIRRLSSGATALARREFGTRVEVQSRDELGQLAGDFNRLADALERFDLRQQQWLADIAHELRTPLAVLRGELEALLEGVRQLDEQRTRSLHQEVLRLTTLVNDLHLLSLAESGGLHLDREPTRLGELISENATRFVERFAARGFTLEIALPNPDGNVSLDAQRIEQVIANLLENALRHATPPGPIRLSGWFMPRKACLQVSDAGPGVPEAALSRLFDRLYRVDASRSRAAGGSGLGLSICRSIVQAHGGQISARRSDRGGLEITVTLPMGDT